MTPAVERSLSSGGYERERVDCASHQPNLHSRTLVATSRRAFTLLEVLVGIAILAMAAVVLGAAYVNTMSAHAAVARRAVEGPGMEYLREAILNEPDRAKVEQGGNVPLPDGRQLQWSATIEELPVPDLFRVEVRGRVDGGKDAEEFTQAVNLLRPTWAESGRRERSRAQWNERRAELERR